jgi:hypothetical protein
MLPTESVDGTHPTPMTRQRIIDSYAHVDQYLIEILLTKLHSRVNVLQDKINHDPGDAERHEELLFSQLLLIVLGKLLTDSYIK